MSPSAVRVNATFEPPVNAHRNGVRTVKCPVTVTATRLPYPLAQPDGVQVMATSAGATETALPLASLVAAHMTEFVVALQAAPAT